MMKVLFVLIATALYASAIEKPEYETLRKDGDFELRHYDSIALVTAPMTEMGKRDQSFRKLFAYIRGENEIKGKISMTAPVFMEPGKMSFMVPKKIAQKGTPKPLAKDVSITSIQSGDFAILRFKGWAKPAEQRKATAALKARIKSEGLEPIGESFFAFYNPPWIPEFFRRNEVWQRVKK